MKKRFIIAAVLASAVILSACGAPPGYDSAVGSEKWTSGDVKAVVQQSSSEVPNSSSSVPMDSSSSSAALPEITNEEIKWYLNAKKSEILKTLGMGDKPDYGAIPIMESHMLCPCIFVDNPGIDLLFPTETEDTFPGYIVFCSDMHLNNYQINGARPGMNFAEIMSKLGKCKVEKTWFSNEELISYRLDYTIDGLKFSFVSNREQGTNSDLFIFSPDD